MNLTIISTELFADILRHSEILEVEPYRVCRRLFYLS